MSSSTDLISKMNALSGELSQARSSTDIISSRRECTRLLNQLKVFLRPLSKADCLAVISNSIHDVEFVDGSILSTLFAIVNNEDELSTEGHRETSVESLKGLVGGAFRNSVDLLTLLDDRDSSDTQQPNREHAQLLTVLFQHGSQTLNNRMQRNTGSSSDFHSGKGTMTEPMESCEYIRLMLVELMLDVSTFLQTVMAQSPNDTKILEAASISCQTLAKYAFSDPYPEVQRASCLLIEKLAQLSPLAVRMSASTLMLPLAGNPESFSTLKNCLFRHRHTKTRSKAVDASIAILLCCPKEAGGYEASPIDSDSVYIENSQPTVDSVPHIDAIKHGSKSTSIEQMLNDSVLSGWGELIKLDASASVRQATLQALGKVASELDWDFSNDSDEGNPSVSAATDLASLVETKVLSLFILGISDGNAQVRALAVEQLSSFRGNKTTVPWNLLARYYQSVLGLVLDQCSLQGVASFQGRVRSIQALQVLLSLVVPLSNKSSIEVESGLRAPEASILRIFEVLSDAILSEEKDVLDASLKACRILGSSDQLSHGILSHVCKTNEDTSAAIEKVIDDEALMTHRRSASTLLLLDGLIKGCQSNNESSSILHDVDSSIAIRAPTWFQKSDAERNICQILESESILKSVTNNSSLAWALLDAVSSFVSCMKDSIEGGTFNPAETTTVGVLTCIAYLLGCPEEFGVFSQAKAVLVNIQPIDSVSSSYMSMLDDNFRQIAMRINSSASFPWKRNDPAFLAVGALLRNTKGSTIRNNFDLVAPLFLYHLPEKKRHNRTAGESNESGSGKDQNEEFSLRISLMSLLQAILSDRSFSNSASMQYSSARMDCSSSQFSTQFTFDILLSLVLPNMVWKSGGLAAALRKLSVAALFALLSRTKNDLGCIEYETYTYLLPILHSNLDDTESTTRELSCACLSLILSEMSPETFQELWNNNTRVLDALHPRLLSLLDDSHNPVRIAALMTIEKYLVIAIALQDHEQRDPCLLGLSSLENTTASLILALDDPEPDVQKQSFEVMSVLIKLVRSRKDIKTMDMIERHSANGKQTHRDGGYCTKLVELCSHK